MESPPEYFTRPDGLRLAFRRVKGKGATIVFLPGYMSDMQGSKALALEAWAIRNNRAMLRFDYAGCGESEGVFEEQTLESWRDDAQMLIENLERGQVVLVGSSMGGWQMLMLALALGSQVQALVGIAAAPDFTDWGYSGEEKAIILRDGRLEQPSPYGNPLIITKALWLSGERNKLLHAEISIDCPVRLLQGQCDEDVPWEMALRIADGLRSSDVQVTLVKDGDHRLSRDQDIALLCATLEQLLEDL